MVNTYSAKPFVSYDGVDENGVRAEVNVVLGFGHVESVEPSKAGKSFKVSFKVDNSEFLPAGWAPDGSNVLESIRKAEESGDPIHFRLETRRQKHIDRSAPLAEFTSLAMAKDSIHKSLAAVKFEGDSEWLISPHAVTRLDEDPVSGSGIYSAYDMPAGTSAPTSASNSSFVGFEPAPHVTTLKDGSLNPGSIAVSVPLNILAFLTEWDRTQETLRQVGEKRRVTVAKILLHAANELQLKIFDGELESPDLGAGSHTRARALLFEVTRTYYPLGVDVVADKESLLEWKANIVEKSLAMWKWSMSEVDNFK